MKKVAIASAGFEPCASKRSISIIDVEATSIVKHGVDKSKVQQPIVLPTDAHASSESG